MAGKRRPAPRRRSAAFLLHREQIIKLREDGCSVRQIGQELGIATSTVQSWLRGPLAPYVRSPQWVSRRRPAAVPEWLRRRMANTVTGEDFLPRGGRRPRTHLVDGEREGATGAYLCRRCRQPFVNPRNTTFLQADDPEQPLTPCCTACVRPGERLQGWPLDAAGLFWKLEPTETARVYPLAPRIVDRPRKRSAPEVPTNPPVEYPQETGGY